MFFEGKYGNQGLARNKGITHSEGKWISFWDSDDFGNPRNLLNAVTLASAETDIVIGQYDSVNPSLDVLSKSYTKHLRNVPKNVGIWRMAFRADRFEGVQFPELQMAEDQVYFARCLLKSEKVEIVGDSFYSYVQGNLGQVTLNMEALRQIPIAIKLLLQLIPRTRNPSKAIIILTMSLRLFITNLKRRFRSG
jgi:glycosyltransferase involved in cell wall biosynthesis